MRPVPLVQLAALFFPLVATIATPPAAQAQSTLIPLTTRRDMVFDKSGKYLYITTSDGWVRPYNLLTKTLEPGYNLGGSLNGADIAPDDSFLLIAQQNLSGAQGTVHRLDLNTNAVININYNLYFEDHPWDLAIASNGRAFFSASRGGSGNELPLRQIDLANNTVTIRSDIGNWRSQGYVYENAQIHRSADRTRLLLVEGSGGTLAYTYDAVTDTFGPVGETSVYGTPPSGAVDRNGSLIGTRRDDFAVLDRSSDLSFKHSFNGVDSGVAFDAVRDLFYVVNRTTSQIVAYDTNTYAEKFRLVIGENVPPVTQEQFDSGTLVASQDGRYLALATPSGIRVIPIPADPLPPQPPIFGRPRDLVFSHSGQYLYITTATGLVWPFNLATQALETPFNVGGASNGADITPDDAFLLITEDNSGFSRGIVHKLNLKTGLVDHIAVPYEKQLGAPFSMFEDGTWDIAIGSNGLAMLAMGGELSFFSGSTHSLRQLDVATSAVTTRSDAAGSSQGKIQANTIIDRSADRTRLLFREPYDPWGPIFSYSATSNSFGPQFLNYNFNEYLNSAVTRDGSHMIIRFESESVMDTLPDFSFGYRWSGAFDSGVAFSAVEDLLFAVRSSTDQIIAYDTNTFAERFRVAIGEDVPATPHQSQNPGDPAGQVQFSTGTLVASQDGRYLALIAPTSVRVIDLATGTSVALPTTPRLGNISTRAFVGVGDDVPIGGFIVTGTDPKKVVLRAMGPSLTPLGVAGAVQDPILELHDVTGAVIALNDNWRGSQENEIALAGFAPGDDREAAIIATLAPGSYTAVVRGKNDTSGIGLVEVYDLDANANSQLANISTRGIVGTGDNVMIAGVIVSSRGGNVGGPAKYLVRGMGPSLTQFQIPNAINDPELWLYDANGVSMAYNNNWKETQRTAIENAALAPKIDRESSIVAELAPGNYTAILQNKERTTGVGLVEVYALQ